MSSTSNLRIIYIKPNDTSFIRGDQHLFEKHYEVKPVLLSQSEGKINYGRKILKLFFLLLANGWRKDTIFISWFADYHSAVMALAGKLIGRKTAIFIGGQEAVCYPELKKGVYRSKIRGAFVKYALRNTSLIIANHKSLIYHENQYYNAESPHIDGIQHYVKGLKTAVEIVYNGINPLKFVRDYSIIKEENLIITVGTMIHTGDFYNKGFDLFIQAAGRNPDLKFMLIGLNPDYLKWTEDNYHVSEFENLKIIPSFCPQDVLNESYNRAKIFVQASITEGMPNTLSEAMLLECIPVGSNINGIPDAIGDTGVVIRQRNVEDLETGIRHALKKETGLQARQRVIELFSFEKRERELLRIFNGMVGKQ